MKIPTVGRSVHYVTDHGICPATVCDVHGNDGVETVDLHVIDSVEQKTYFRFNVPYSEEASRGCWKWPELV